MITFPNCKINLGLWVTQRRTDGFHNLQTVMYPVPWCDALEILPANENKTSLTISGNPFTSEAESNLCYRAWQLMSDTYSIPSVRIHLHKAIPTGAGLGGGSSNAAFTLKMLNHIYDLNLDNETLIKLSLQLGMDCPFFIENIPSLASGRGDILKPSSLNLNGYYVVVVKPSVHVSTAVAFTGIKPKFREESIEEIIKLPIQEWRNLLNNDFEKTIFSLYPEIEDIKNKMYRKGALFTSMSGSGSAVYGIFSENPKLDFKEHESFKTLLGSHSQ